MLCPFCGETPIADTIVWYYKLVEYQLCTYFYTTWHELWKCSKNRYFQLWDRSIFPIFKMHLRHFWRNSTQLQCSHIPQTGTVSAFVLIFILLDMSSEHARKIDICIVVRFFQFSKCFSTSVLRPFSEKLHSVQYSSILQTGRVSAYVLISIVLDMTSEHARKIDICIVGGEVHFSNFQSASPHKCSGHFLRNSTQLYYWTILQTGGVSRSVLIASRLTTTSERARKIYICIMGSVDLLQLPKSVSA